MPREPKASQSRSQDGDAKKPERFRFVKLEERIAPKCHYNPQGKKVGCTPHSNYP